MLTHFAHTLKHIHMSGFAMTALERAKTRKKNMIQTTVIVALLGNIIQVVARFGNRSSSASLRTHVTFYNEQNAKL